MVRPFLPSGSGSGSSPVRLTPVTGKISRAKKGVAVHECDQCHPPKVFTRAEHLRRHQLSHKPPDLHCPVPGCIRTFHRKDLLERHQQKHEQEGIYAKPRDSISPPPPAEDPSPVNWPYTNIEPPTSTPGPYPPHPEPPVPSPSIWPSPYPISQPEDPNMFHPFHPVSEPFPVGWYNSPIPYSTVRSMPPTLVFTSSETVVTTASALPADRLGMPHLCGPVLGPPLGLPTPPPTVPLSLSLATISAIPAYLNTYWERVSPLYPAIHNPTLEELQDIHPDHADVLRCAMAAVATQFLSDEDSRVKGHELHAYAWQNAKALMPSGTWSLAIMQTVLLCEYYARFRGKGKASYRPSHEFTLLYHMVLQEQNTFIPIPAAGDQSQQWRVWVQMEVRRRLLAACFLLDVHSMCYFEQPSCGPMNGLDYSCPETLPIPLTAGTVELWAAQTPEEWSGLIGTQRSMTTVRDLYLVGSNMARHGTGMPSFDTSILLAAQLLQVKKQQPSTKTDFIPNASAIRADELPLISRFPDLPASNSYMALHYTPLYTLLAVSGESWVLNDKISHIESFVGLKEQLKDWQASGSCAAATVFAARALRSMLKIDQSASASDEKLERQIKYRHVSWKDLSDYWAFYTSVLICWAFGHGKRQVDHGDSSLLTAISWIRDAANSQPSQLQGQACESETRAIVGLGLELLKKDCLGNRNRLFADSINVLRRLQEVDRPRF